MSTQEIPWRWAERLIARGFEKERGEGASVDQLAKAAGLHTTTVTRVLLGLQKPSTPTVQALCAVLGDDVAEWLDSPAPRPWVPPDEVALLTDRQRVAVEAVIRAMANPRGQDDGTPIAKRVTAKQTRTARTRPALRHSSEPEPGPSTPSGR